MKYNDNNQPITCIMKQSTCYKGTRVMDKVYGVLWHSTGACNPYIKRYVQPDDNAPDREQLLIKLGKNIWSNDWNHIYREAGVNAWIGKLNDDSIATVQTLPWNYEPWGCGSGINGSCNKGWIQFEICEDNLTNEEYFNAVYKEAIELTAFLCKKYNINPKGVVNYKNGVSVPTILCHADSYALGKGNNHGDVYHWFNKYGKTMDNVRNDVLALLNQNEEEIDNTIIDDLQFKIGSIITLKPGTRYIDNKKIPNWVFKAVLYIRKVTEDTIIFSTQQSGAITGAVKKENVIIKQPETQTTLHIGDQVILKQNISYTDGKIIPQWLYKFPLYVRAINFDNFIFSTQKTGTVTGATDIINAESVILAQPYTIRIIQNRTPVYETADINSAIKLYVNSKEAYTIIEESKNFGKLKSSAGWINLNDIEKV